MALRNSEIASNTFSVSENKPQEYSETNETSRGHYKASCKYCPVLWDRGRPDNMRLHLAQQLESLNKAILKAWIICNFSFETIENPFIIDLFQLAIPGFDLPLRDRLSGRFIDQEVLRIDKRIDNDLEKEEYLTL
ncbi:21837_t:CDS:2, partial [Gigaspora rosea]